MNDGRGWARHLRVVLAVAAVAVAVSGCTSINDYVLRRPQTGCGSTDLAPINIPQGTPGTAALSDKQRQIAATIVSQGIARNISLKGQEVAMTVAYDESHLRNLANASVPELESVANDGVGDNADSVGVFQQRPSMGWGTPTQLMDPAFAADKFYDALVKVPSWQSMSIPDAAATVQRNLNGASDYARYVDVGRTLADGMNNAGVQVENVAEAEPASPTGTGTGTDGDSGSASACGQAGGAGSTADILNFLPGGPAGPNAVAAAYSEIGIRYSWGGGDLNGPTIGVHDYGVADSFGDYDHVGFDCSGFARWVIHKATGKVIGRTSQVQSTEGLPVASEADAQPGDLVFYGGEGVAGHVGIYIGGGQMIDAPQSGEKIRKEPLYRNDGPITFRRFT